MILINNDAKPKDTVYYAACCVLSEMSGKKPQELKVLYGQIKESYDLPNLNYIHFQLAISFLFLVGKVQLKDSKIVCA